MSKNPLWSADTERTFFRARAPFAAWRPFTAGTYRPTHPVPPPSSLYGLVLCLQGIEIRDTPKSELPSLAIAMGQMRIPEIGTVVRQAHHKPVGAADKELRAMARGTKHLIAPVRYEVVCGVDLVVGVEGLPKDVVRLRDALQSGVGGVPFAGDNGMGWDSFEELTELQATALGPRWWTINPTHELAYESQDLTVWVDYEDASRTEVVCLGPRGGQQTPPYCPLDAWVLVSPPG